MFFMIKNALQSIICWNLVTVCNPDHPDQNNIKMYVSFLYFYHIQRSNSNICFQRYERNIILYSQNYSQISGSFWIKNSIHNVYYFVHTYKLRTLLKNVLFEVKMFGIYTLPSKITFTVMFCCLKRTSFKIHQNMPPILKRFSLVHLLDESIWT